MRTFPLSAIALVVLVISLVIAWPFHHLTFWWYVAIYLTVLLCAVDQYTRKESSLDEDVEHECWPDWSWPS